MQRTHRTSIGILVLVLVALLLASCAAGPNPLVGTDAASGAPAGFWRGLWHGLILPITFLISLFTESVSIYEVHNSGGWYDFGYVVGLMLCSGSGAKSGHTVYVRQGWRRVPE